MVEYGLGRLPATDDNHIRKYPLTASTMPTLPTPVVIGINWYSAFDLPTQNVKGASWIGTGNDWGYVRGGHAICVKPPRIQDADGWWDFYNQASTSKCVGHSSSRMMSLLNRQRYDAPWLYREAQKIDEWAGESYEGTSVRAGMDVLRTRGHVRVLRNGYTDPEPHIAYGIAENRWALSVEQIAACLDPTTNGAIVLNAGYVTLLNSWGRAYPHFTRLPLAALDQLIFNEDGDATVIIDRF